MENRILMTPDHLSRARRWAALAIVLFGQFVVSIDMTVLNIALPDLSADLQPSSDQQLWIVDVYSLVVAGLLVSASSLSDRWGRKRMLLGGFAVFGIASAFILVANTAEAVIAVRALLGVGGAMIMPTTISFIRNIFSIAKERAFALAAWSVMSGLGMAVGPLIGGALLELFSWHAAFFVNVPLMLLAFIPGLFVLPEIRVKNPGPWDAVAALMSLAGMALLMWGIKHLAAIMSLTDPAGLGAIAVGLALMIAFVVRCARSPQPLMDVTLFRSKPFTAGILAALGSMFAMAALLFLLAQWLQLVDGCSPLESGIKLVPMALASIVAGGVAPSVAMRLGARNTIFIGLAIAGIAMVAIVPFKDDLTYPVIAAVSCLVGVGTGALAVSSSVIMVETPTEKASSAAAFEEISYDLGNVLGVAVLGSVASIIYKMGLNASALTTAGLDNASIEAARQSLSAAEEIAQATGVAELLTESTLAFSDSIVFASLAGGMALLIVAPIVWKLIPKSLDIAED